MVYYRGQTISACKQPGCIIDVDLTSSGVSELYVFQCVLVGHLIIEATVCLLKTINRLH